MFPASSVDLRPIDTTLLPVVREIEERSPRLRVLAARQFRYSVQQQKIRVRVERRRKMDLLEKFVLRAFAEIFPTPPPGELADALGLDPIFIDDALNKLYERKLIISTNGVQSVTEEGKKTLNAESISEDQHWYYLQDTVLATQRFIRHSLDEMDEKLEQLEDLNFYVKQDLTRFPVFDMDAPEHQSELQELGLDGHDPDEGQFVTGLTPDAPPELRWRRIAIFVLHDSLSENEDTKITFQARSKGVLVPGVGKWLEEQLQEQHLSLKALCGLNSDTIPLEEETQIESGPEEQLVGQLAIE
jgi:DNA-binding MarR family transcriptional regulator